MAETAELACAHSVSFYITMTKMDTHSISKSNNFTAAAKSGPYKKQKLGGEATIGNHITSEAVHTEQQMT
eukprot:5206385-Ditylum_brightwellii.AAC.1